ncbi:MAG: hypothetical protein JO114_17490 [Planctomycetaceae bacterium]|nr:hypothetical protein [Planctomycetaceae bacterium]MBV8308859.1 hypothetical protein [Planctomycetaceae bacterium]
MLINLTKRKHAPHPSSAYDEKFFCQIGPGALRSARAVAPLILDLAPIRSVVDFGCADGCWLRAFQDLGVEDILGLDGNYVDRDRLLIDRHRFRDCDLASPVRLERNFDLALSLEVAEHLPTRSSRDFVQSLVRAAPIVLFSAAIPGQGGTRHINEQWPEFWHKLFDASGYKCLDCLRGTIITDPNVEWWYKQNIYLYVKSEEQVLERLCGVEGFSDLDIIGTRILDRYKSSSGLTKRLVRTVARTIKNRMNGFH